MASSGGNSSGSTQLQNNSGSEAELQDQRKRKRMESNRESARRSRLRKQNHVDELMAQATQLKKENNQIVVTTNTTTQNYMKIEAENSVLRAQMDELSQRLQSLNDILYYINSTAADTTAAAASMDGVFDIDNYYGTGLDENLMNNPWNNMMYLNQQQPIIASADHMLFQY